MLKIIIYYVRSALCFYQHVVVTHFVHYRAFQHYSNKKIRDTKCITLTFINIFKPNTTTCIIDCTFYLQQNFLCRAWTFKIKIKNSPPSQVSPGFLFHYSFANLTHLTDTHRGRWGSSARRPILSLSVMNVMIQTNQIKCHTQIKFVA